jgi:hypothetical protein
MSLPGEILNPTQADLKAIIDYVNGVQPDAVKTRNARALSLIQSFQGWYQNLGPLDHIFDQETLNEAKRRRNEINVALGTTIPLDQVPADAPQTPPNANVWVTKLEKDISDAPSQVVTLVKVAAVVGVGIVLWNLYQGTKKTPHTEHDESEDDIESRAEAHLRHST